jgi:hypothetical protein
VLDPVMLRSAEADPHVTEAQMDRQADHPSRTAFVATAEATAPPAISPPSGRLPRAVARQPEQLTEASSLVPEAEASDLSSLRAINTEASTAETVLTLAEQPTSRLCSTDESVVTEPPLPVTDHPFLPWALFLSKVLQSPPSP